jgi:hypothetical protein
LLGKPNVIDKSSFLSKNTVGYIYCIDKTTINDNCNKYWKRCSTCKRSSITIILTNELVIDMVKAQFGG